MAHMVGGDFSEDRPELEWSQEFEDWYEPIARARWTENRKRDRADPLYPRGLGPMLGFGGGIAFPQPPRPLKVRVKKLPGNVLPDFLAVTIISERIRVKVEEMEPEVHQYLPLEVELPDGSISEVRYWIWCNMNMLDTLVLEKSKFMQPYYFNKEKWPDYYEYEDFGDHINKPVLALNKSIIAGKVRWSDYKLRLTFVSDEFANWLDSEGIKGWKANDGTSRNTTLIEV